MLQVHELTGSGLAVSALFAATMVPVVALAPLAGLLADRVESVRLLVLASVAQALVAAGLAFTDSLAAILLLSALLGLGSAVSQPAEFALVPAVAARTRDSPDAHRAHVAGPAGQGERLGRDGALRGLCRRPAPWPPP